MGSIKYSQFITMQASCCLLLLSLALSQAGSVTRLSASSKVSTRTSASQRLTCYDYANQGGNSVVASDYIPNLQNYNMDNRISSCCFSGIWLIYADPNYNGNNIGAANWWAYGDNYCTNVPAQFDNVASSLRFTGAPDDLRYDTLNLYFNDYFIGDEEFTYDDKPALNYDNRAKSVIVTGCHPWTLYQYDNYQGQAMCVYPSDTSSCNPGFYTTSQSLGSLAGQISSARRGCYAQEKVLPDNHGLKTGENGASGFFPIRK